jgi:glycosyltransferase involved in cell wall biosynthesis
MRILIVTPWCDDIELKSVKGMPLNAFLINKIIQRKHKVDIICYEGIPCYSENYKLHKLKNIPRVPSVFGLNIFFFLYYNFLLYKKIKDYAPDLLLDISGRGIIALKILSKKRKIPLVVKSLGTFEFSKSPCSLLKVIQYFSEFCIAILNPSLIIALNDGSAPTKGFKAWNKKIRIIEVINPRPIWRVNKKRASNRVKIGYLSRFSKLKGTHFLTKIAQNILHTYSEVEFIISGDGNYRKEIQTLVSQFPNQAKYHGFLYYNQMPKVYEKIDILVSPNIYGSGTLPVIEAMSVGIPVVAFDVLDTKKFIIDKKTGFLVPPFNVKEFIQKLKLLIEDKKLREKMGEEAKKFVINSNPSYDEWATFIVNKIEETTKNRLVF